MYVCMNMLIFFCQFNVKSICVQINKLETYKQSDSKGCAAPYYLQIGYTVGVILCQHQVCHGTVSPTSENQPYHDLYFISCLIYMLYHVG